MEEQPTEKMIMMKRTKKKRNNEKKKKHNDISNTKVTTRSRITKRIS